MFASPNNYFRSKSTTITESSNYEGKEKFSRLLLIRIRKNFDFFEPNVRIAEEIVKFVNRKGITENDLKEFDNKIKNIVIEMKPNVDKSMTRLSTFSNTNLNSKQIEIYDSQPLLSVNNANDEKSNQSTNKFSDNIKLPKVQSIIGTESTGKPDSRRSNVSKMSGASKLSKFSKHDPHNYHIIKWLKNYPYLKEIDIPSNNQQNLPYDINDYNSIIQYDVMQYNEELKVKKQAQRDLKLMVKRGLEEQIEEKQSKVIEAINMEKDLEEYLNGTKIDNANEENEWKEIIQNKYIRENLSE